MDAQDIMRAAAEQETLNAYSDAADGLRAFLSWAKTYPVLATVPQQYVQPGELAKWAAEAHEITTAWKDDHDR